jgi:hypothetical protein
MNARLLYVAAAVAAAYLATPTFGVSAKEDPAKQAADRDALRKEYEAAKKYLTQDLTYFVDSSKLKDSRWEISTKLPAGPDPNQGIMFSADFPSGNPTDATPSIQFRVFKCAQSVTKDGKKSTYSHEFKAWGKSVDLANVKEMAEGYYMEFMASATEPIAAKSKKPDKHEVGPAKLWGCAVGTDKESKKRVRMDWYFWTDANKVASFLWWAEVTTADKFIDNKEWIDKIDDLMKNMAEVKDPRAKQ